MVTIVRGAVTLVPTQGLAGPSSDASGLVLNLN
jgi:hypothetical protein